MRTHKLGLVITTANLFFGVMALLTGILALCSRLFAFLASFTTFLAMIIQAAAAAVMTYVECPILWL